MATKRVFKYVNGLKIEVLAPWGPRERKEPIMGWLSIWFNGGQDQNPPDRKYYVARGEITKTVDYWCRHCVGDIRFDFAPENATDALKLILADETPTLTALERIMA